MPKIETWKSQPVENEILLHLMNNRGEILTTDLYRKLTNRYLDFTRAELNDYLFRMEVRGLIYVVPIKKDVSKIEICSNANFSNELSQLMNEFHH